jgi:ketosteroid isomerase-like protein
MPTNSLTCMKAAALALGLALLSTAAAADDAATGPTTENALAADQQLATAIRNNDPQGIEAMLDDDWMVVAATGGMGAGKNIFPDGIKSGDLTRKTFELIAPRVRLYGNVALVTAKVKTSGMFGGKPFDVMERQTDVLVWKDGAWKCVLSHETKFDMPSH